MTGATASTNGKAGLVPAPSAGNQDYYLKADGTWTSIADKAAVGHKHVIADVDGLQAALDSKAAAAAVTPISHGGTGATTAADARKNLGIATVADKPVTELYNGGSDDYVRWGCRNGVVTIAWSVKQTTTNQWKAGSIGKAYAPAVVANGGLTVASWAPHNQTATAWITSDGNLYLHCPVAQSDGRNVGSMTYIAHG